MGILNIREKENGILMVENQKRFEEKYRKHSIGEMTVLINKLLMKSIDLDVLDKEISSKKHGNYHIIVLEPSLRLSKGKGLSLNISVEAFYIKRIVFQNSLYNFVDYTEHVINKINDEKEKNMQKIHNDDLILKVQNQEAFEHDYFTTYRHGMCLIVEYGVDMNSIFNSDLDEILKDQYHPYTCIVVKYEETPAGAGHKWYYLEKIVYEEKGQETVHFKKKSLEEKIKENINAKKEEYKSENPFKKSKIDWELLISIGMITGASIYGIIKAKKAKKSEKTEEKSTNKNSDVLGAVEKGLTMFKELVSMYRKHQAFMNDKNKFDPFKRAAEKAKTEEDKENKNK